MAKTNIMSFKKIKRNPQALGRFIKYLFIIAVLFFIILPFYVAFCYAFKFRHDLIHGPLSFPLNPTLSNFRTVILGNKVFIIGLKNSIINTIFSVIILVIIASMASYPLARFNQFFYQFMYTLLTLGILIPFSCIMLALYLNMYNAGLTSTNIGYIIARVGMQVSIGILVMTSFIRTIPYDLEEAAGIDGASRFRVFWEIVFPLMRPIVIVQIVLNTIFCWNDYNVAVVLLRENTSKTLILAQLEYFSTNIANLNLAFAFFILAMAPIIILYFCMQEYVVSGITSGALKG